jgi:hypothetical protein
MVSEKLRLDGASLSIAIEEWTIVPLAHEPLQMLGLAPFVSLA